MWLGGIDLDDAPGCSPGASFNLASAMFGLTFYLYAWPAARRVGLFLFLLDVLIQPGAEESPARPLPCPVSRALGVRAGVNLQSG